MKYAVYFTWKDGVGDTYNVSSKEELLESVRGFNPDTRLNKVLRINRFGEYDTISDSLLKEVLSIIKKNDRRERM